jgi:uncharacterized protein (DUF924 family)
MSAEEILDFWFGQPDAADYGKQRSFWFTKKPQFDQELRSRFLPYYEQAVVGKLDDWKKLPHSSLALILLLDQFPRNMFRGTAQAFVADPQALSVAQHAVANGYDQELLMVQRWFIYLPFEHSENLADQRQSVRMFATLSDHPDNALTLDYAIRHYYVIARFGRFPHRNKILVEKRPQKKQSFSSNQAPLFK